MLNAIWILKACMLLMFARMTSGTTHNKWIKIVAIYVAVGWVAVQIAFFTACMPFSGYWAVPVSNPQCTTLEHFAIVQAVFNLSSDVLIIAVPIPMIMSLTLPTKQKVGLGLLFSMGTFVVRLVLNVSHHHPLTLPKDHRCNSHQSLQPFRRIRYGVHALVHTRSLSRRICCQSARHLAPDARTRPLPTRPHQLVHHRTISHATLRLWFQLRESIKTAAQSCAHGGYKSRT